MIKKILISQPQPASDKSPYYDIEKEFGVECVFHPFFKVEGLSAKEFRQQRINLLDYTATLSIIISTWQKRCASPYLRI